MLLAILIVLLYILCMYSCSLCITTFLQFARLGPKLSDSFYADEFVKTEIVIGKRQSGAMNLDS